MTIKRNGKTYTLTAEELEQAYREQKHNYLLSDAEAQFNDYHRIHFSDEEQFADCFGFFGDDVCDVNSEHYLLEKFVAAFEKGHDCEQAENDVWHEIIRNVLVDNAANFKIHYIATYDLYDARMKGLRKITTLFPAGYASLEELYAAAPEYLAKTFERDGLRNGTVAVRTNIKKVKRVGSSPSKYYTTCLDFIKLGWDRRGTMVDGKLQFNDAEVEAMELH